MANETAKFVEINDKAFLDGLREACSNMAQQDGLTYLTSAADLIANRARSHAPVLQEPDPRRVAGALKAAITVSSGTTQSGVPYVYVGLVNASPLVAEYGFFQEYGTFDQPARPFMRPAVASV